MSFSPSYHATPRFLWLALFLFSFFFTGFWQQKCQIGPSFSSWSHWGGNGDDCGLYNARTCRHYKGSIVTVACVELPGRSGHGHHGHSYQGDVGWSQIWLEQTMDQTNCWWRSAVISDGRHANVCLFFCPAQSSGQCFVSGQTSYSSNVVFSDWNIPSLQSF